ncbi:adenosylcobinamide-phosphate guanylyltransferase [Paenibacillus sp. 32O-W]|uniref:bifunctional adenosylcobinamide kinase/adenosylcobinamide-phosphate guanylyltransferase n=1 Tax=Paenibacillus sp. 32O-W TaxID=1695218 RepID=UPI00071EAFC2|nr:bifunctional adenosylcobinamide kinase/adenosylcobinamide-phosphate guanylyltransferase [Paenibacillus sp. 32O-W]ALS27672.1 adenosylcobinamide-phosphate guanylyltransferase [Paenibacillus sp. 32O-W]
MENKTVLVTGGARSGKSSFAERLAARLGRRGVYVATSQALDDEMAERIRRHRRQRDEDGFPWETVEVPYALAERLDEITQSAEPDTVVLVDCLTLWLSNWLLRLEADGEGAAEAEERLAALAEQLAAVVRQSAVPLILVTNEVGSGIVPAYPLGRQFRDAAGRVNRRLAEVCGRVFLVVAGIPIDLKAAAFRMEEWDNPDEKT